MTTIHTPAEGLAADTAVGLLDASAPAAGPAPAAPLQALLTPSEVAGMFRVDPKTVTRWAKAGKLTSIRTLGGHRRYRSAEVLALLQSAAPSDVAAALPAPRASEDDASA